MASEASTSYGCRQDLGSRGSNVDSDLLAWACSKLYVLPDDSNSTISCAASGAPGNTLKPHESHSQKSAVISKFKKQEQRRTQEQPTDWTDSKLNTPSSKKQDWTDWQMSML